MSFVYAIKPENIARVKIGWAIDPIKRRAALQTGASARLHVIAVRPGSRSDESALHRAFACDRIVGTREWFSWSPAISQHVKQWRITYKELQTPLTNSTQDKNEERRALAVKDEEVRLLRDELAKANEKLKEMAYRVRNISPACEQAIGLLNAARRTMMDDAQALYYFADHLPNDARIRDSLYPGSSMDLKDVAENLKMSAEGIDVAMSEEPIGLMPLRHKYRRGWLRHIAQRSREITNQPTGE